MRETQFIGLSPATEYLINDITNSIVVGTRTITDKYFDTDIPLTRIENILEVSPKKESKSQYKCSGMVGEDIPLDRFTFSETVWLEECVLLEIWSSGPMIFTALRDHNGNWIKESLWENSGVKEVQANLVSSSWKPEDEIESSIISIHEFTKTAGIK